MVNTAMQAFGWVLGLLAWGACVGMLMSEKWRVSSITGDMASALDTQDRHEGLWSTCNKFPSGETYCTLLPIEISNVQAVIVGCRALIILSILFGIISALVILIAFKCTSHGPSEIENKAMLGRYGGGVYLLCGVSVTVAGAWYIADVYTTITLPDARGNPIVWTTGEGVQVTLAAGLLWLIASAFVMLGSRIPHDSNRLEQKKPLYQEYI